MPRRPALALIREGNVGHHSQERLDRGLKLTPTAPPEPKWTDILPSGRGKADATRLRRWAAEEWRRIVPVLDAQGLLASVDSVILTDHCLAWSLSRECYRRISLEGLVIEGQRGSVRHPATTVLAAQRDRLKHTVVQLGLSPLARDALKGGAGDEQEGDAFD